ncbi:glycosyltransferase family 2 protein [Seongchinamella unica]|uniref:Glycosyltransferase family 2 protein n=1 Tax=Seongchinamella unica TaxID=2547392 RepID=A0A4R5LUM5_9GAMM|nr:glycosyltransferase family 2 protein [Seongchinamella unica]TDG15114.1 glycosyltransferase family 2 protein [Seongchinamella unica]
MTGSKPEVAVLLCTHNGSDFLAEQLESIDRQQGVSVNLFVSDDASTDGTWEMLQAIARSNKSPGLHLRQGPASGSAKNFLSLLCDENIVADYYCFADQDDIWDSDKLTRAIAKMQQSDDRLATLYCGRTRSLSVTGQVTGLSPLFRKKAAFANALIQNIGGGNTMVMNDPARTLLLRAGIRDAVSHDWWAYLLISGAGGKVIYDPQPYVSYRQHAGNQIGANTGMGRRISRYLGVLGGRNRCWNDRNIAALEACAELLETHNRDLLLVFKQWRQEGVIKRLSGLRTIGLYTQTFWGNLGLLCATILKKV